MLSILTQDEKGLELYDIPIRVKSWYQDGKIVSYHITQFRDNENVTLGIYKTLERALEVLEEIGTTKIENDMMFYHYGENNVLECVAPMTSIYEMPKE